MTYKFTQSQMCNVSRIVNEWQQMYQIVAEASKLGTSWIWLHHRHDQVISQPESGLFTDKVSHFIQGGWLDFDMDNT